jgi:hypothetical protein
MKILLLGNPYFQRDFEEAGHQVKTVGFERPADIRVEQIPAGVEEILARLPSGWEPDFVMLGDESTQPYFVGLEELDVPLGWYAVDSHIHLGWHRAYAPVFDFIWVAQRDAVAHYCLDAARQLVQWLPLFCDPREDRDLGLARDYPLSFVGTLNPDWNPERVALIEKIRNRFPIHVETGPYVGLFNRSKLVLNQCAANDINFRTFQAMACGALLLQERIGNGLTDLFTDRVHVVLYDKGDVDQILELTRYYVAHEAERRAIAAAGQEAVLLAHTSRRRAETLLALLASLDLSGMIRRRKAALPEIRFLLAAIYEHTAEEYRLAAAQRSAGPSQAARRRAVAERYDTLAMAVRGKGACTEGRISE